MGMWRSRSPPWQRSARRWTRRSWPQIPEAATVERSDEIVAILNRVLPTRSFADWQPRLEAEKIWHTRVNDYDDVRNDPQVQHNQTFVTVEGATGADITVVNHAIRYDGEAASVGLPPQQLGAQTREILAELGYDPAAIEALLKAGAVRAAEA